MEITKQMCVQFYPKNFCEAFNLLGKYARSYGYIRKPCAFYYCHTGAYDTHTLNIYVLPTDEPQMEGVSCSWKIPAQVPLSDMKSFRIQGQCVAKHPYHGNLCVVPRQEILGFGTQIEKLKLDSPCSVGDIDFFMKRIESLDGWVIVNTKDEQKNNINDVNGDMDEPTTSDGNTFDITIPLSAGNFEEKEACLEEFKSLFSINCLYVEHKICESLKQRGLHGGYSECRLCTRMSEFDTSRDLRPVNVEGNEIYFTEDVLVKTELLFDLQAFGFNIYGSSLMINGKLCEGNSRVPQELGPIWKHINFGCNVSRKHIPMYVAIRQGHMSWIQAFIAIGIELENDFPDGELVKYALHFAPEQKLCAITKLLLANGAVMTEDTDQVLYDRATTLIQQSDCHKIAQLLVDLGCKKDLMPLVNIAAANFHYRCLKVRFIHVHVYMVEILAIIFFSIHIRVCCLFSAHSHEKN